MSTSEIHKRKDPPSADNDSKTKKAKRQWRTPREIDGKNGRMPPAIEPGDAGIWATCAMSKEGKSVSDLKDLFARFTSAEARSLNDSSGPDGGGNEDEDRDAENGHDIESSIATELQGLSNDTQRSKEGSSAQACKPLIQPIKIDIQCVLFFRLQCPPLDPVSLVQKVCNAFASDSRPGGCRFVKRLTPISRMARASLAGLDDVCAAVLPAVFGADDGEVRRYAIRPTIRNHTVLKRLEVIEYIAGKVKEMGNGRHVVDLGSPARVILIDIYRNILGMSVVDGQEYERLKRYNLAELGVIASSEPVSSTRVQISEQSAQDPSHPSDDQAAETVPTPTATE